MQRLGMLMLRQFSSAIPPLRTIRRHLSPHIQHSAVIEGKRGSAEGASTVLRLFAASARRDVRAREAADECLEPAEPRSPVIILLSSPNFHQANGCLFLSLPATTAGDMGVELPVAWPNVI